MSKSKIEFDYNGTHYVLEHTAASLKKAEKIGLVQFGKIDEQLLVATENMFYSLFICNHPTTPMSVRREIYNALARTTDGMEDTEDDALADAVATIVNEAVDEITGRGKKGNLNWKVTT